MPALKVKLAVENWPAMLLASEQTNNLQFVGRISAFITSNTTIILKNNLKVE